MKIKEKEYGKSMCTSPYQKLLHGQIATLLTGLLSKETFAWYCSAV